MMTLVGLNANAAAIDDYLSAGQVRHPGYMRVSAKYQRCRARRGALFDFRERRGHQFAVTDVLEKTRHIAVGSRMTKKNAVRNGQRGRQRLQPLALRVANRVGSVTIRWPHAVAIGSQ